MRDLRSRHSNRRAAVVKAALLAAPVLMLGAGRVKANTIQWVASVGDITVNTNWQGNTLPGINDVGDINNAGEAQISGGESFTAGEIRVGDSGGSGYGVLTQTGGTITATNWFVVGRFTNGDYNMSAGTLNKTGGGMLLIAGGDSSQAGVMRMSGTASVVMAGSGTFADGDSEYNNNQGNAELFMQDSASIDTGGAEFWVGNNTGCVGYLNMGGGTLSVSSWVSVGRTGGYGSVDLSDGAINKTGDNGTHFIVGDSNNGSAIGTGVINQSGGALNSANSDFWLGSNGDGTYNIAGGSLTTLALDMAINPGSNGMLNLNGGIVSSTVVSAGGGAASINFNGGVLQARASNASFLQNFTSAQLNVQSGGAIFDTGGFDNTITAGLQGVGGLTLQGSGGSLTLSGSSSYAGDTTVNGGTLIVGASGTLGTGSNINLNAGALAIASDAAVSGKSFNFNGGALQLQNYDSSAISFSNVSNLTLGAATGTASSFAGLISGNGSLTYVGPGTLNLTNPANDYSGGTLITAGVVEAVPGSLGSGTITVSGTGLLGISSDSGIPASLVFNGGGISFNNYSSALNFNPGLNLTLGAASGAASTLTGTITDGPSSSTSLNYVGPGTLNLAGINTYTGGTTVSAGTVNFTSTSLGSGAVVLNGGTLQYATGNMTDLTASPFKLSLGQSGGGIDTNGNDVSYAGNIAPAAGLGSALPGAFEKSGAGTLTLNGSLSTSSVLVRQGALLLGGNAMVSTATDPVSNANDYSSIGSAAGDDGTLTLTGSSTYLAAGDLNIADQSGSTGTLNLQDSAAIQVRTLYVGKSGTAVGTVNQTGGALIEADNGAGAGDWRIGGSANAADAAAVGIYNLSGGTFDTGGANLQVGAYGTGTFVQTGGEVSVGSFLSIGRFGGGVGVYNLSGGSVTANTQPVSVVGEGGNGTLIVSGNSTFTTNGLLIAQDDGGTGTVQQMGGTINAPNGVRIGQNQTGNLSAPASGVYNLGGGTLQTPSITGSNSANLTSTVNFNGGTLVATQSGTTLVQGLTHAYVQSGGLNLDASVGSVSIAQPLLHDATDGAPAIDGGLTLLGGQLVMTAPSNTYTGQTLIADGMLIAGAANTLSPSSAIIVSGGVLDVSGFSNSIAGLTVGSAGTINFGSSVVLTDTGSAAFDGVLNLVGTPDSLPYTLMTYSGFTGNFATANLPDGDLLSYTSTALLLTNSSGSANLVYLNTGLAWDVGTTAAFNGGSGATVFHDGDNVTFDDSNPAGPYTVSISGTVSPASTIFNNSAGNYVVSGADSTSGIAGAGSLTKQGSGTLTLLTNNTYTGGTQVAAGTLILASAGALPINSPLSIAAGAKLTIADHGSGPAFVPVISSLNNAGTIDVVNNAMVLHNASYEAIWSQVQAGFNNGNWNGSSGAVITSSAAAGDPTHLTAVGVATGLTSFEGQSVSTDDVLVKYTYYGDANLDGVVDGSDYTRIDNGFNDHLTGWLNGDFNYDGIVDGSDYTLIDNAFNVQGASLAAELAAAPAAGSALTVPEPSALALLALTGLGVLSRRRGAQ